MTFYVLLSFFFLASSVVWTRSATTEEENVRAATGKCDGSMLDTNFGYPHSRICIRYLARATEQTTVACLPV